MLAMNDLERYQELLSRGLEGRLESPEIRVIETEPYRYAGIIVSPTFAEMEDHDRQRLAWQAVLDTFNEEDRRWIEFLYTHTPAEMAAFAEADEQTVEKG
jgi:hypothetical protein